MHVTLIPPPRDRTVVSPSAPLGMSCVVFMKGQTHETRIRFHLLFLWHVVFEWEYRSGPLHANTAQGDS
ncbi:hypothetical protein nbrc107696_44570 [Gordonia spumicola]|uniref:Uncharacterized protein n=1 Tax=Gordonia spumicola TaxID=589161 RepID=A0A7I9VFY8_9ACTN|nr:hypothetical protein nbrc107696_44570 [Gordonia spumicola]